MWIFLHEIASSGMKELTISLTAKLYDSRQEIHPQILLNFLIKFSFQKNPKISFCCKNRIRYKHSIGPNNLICAFRSWR